MGFLAPMLFQRNATANLFSTFLDLDDICHHESCVFGTSENETSFSQTNFT